MGLLSIGNIGPIDGNNPNIGKTGEVKQETLNSVFGAGTPSNNQIGAKKDPYEDFNNFMNDTKLGNKFLNEADLLKKGFKPEPGIRMVRGEDGELKGAPDPDSQLMDMNGGKYYYNEKTGEKVRICDFERSNQYTKGRTKHTQWFGEDGKPAGGYLEITQIDGSIKIYDYDLDVNGNKFIKSVKVQQPEYFPLNE